MKKPISVQEAVLPAYFCFLLNVFFSYGILELCFKFRYSVLLKVNIPVVGREFSLKLLEIQPLFILINVSFSKEKEQPIPNLWVETVEELICIQPSQFSPALV